MILRAFQKKKKTKLWFYDLLFQNYWQSYPYEKREKTINFSIETKKLDKKPTQSFFKSYLKLAAQAGNTRQKFGMRINNVAFLGNYLNYTGKNFKITNNS